MRRATLVCPGTGGKLRHTAEQNECRKDDDFSSVGLHGVLRSAILCRWRDSEIENVALALFSAREFSLSIPGRTIPVSVPQWQGTPPMVGEYGLPLLGWLSPGNVGFSVG